MGKKSIKGLKALIKKIENLSTDIEEVRGAWLEKREWFDGKSDTWQESETGEEWSELIDEVDSFLELTENFIVDLDPIKEILEMD